MGWLGSWLLLLPTTLFQISPFLVIVAVLVRTQLQTGLFIVAHDAMHGTLWPTCPGLNRRLGELALLLYGALSYDRCRANHLLHHRYAGTLRDPDHHGEGNPSLFGWYGHFMAAYLLPSQLTLLVLSWLVLVALAAPFTATPLPNVLLYGALPVLLSSLQLFVVGTYLPHRGTETSPAEESEHCPRSLHLPGWLSWLACFHFGYHWEHHAFPHLAWHQLPAAKARINDGFRSRVAFAVSLSGR